MDKGQIKFEDATSQFLACTCGNDTMDSGFDSIETGLESIHDECSTYVTQHYICNNCEVKACVNFSMRLIHNSK